MKGKLSEAFSEAIIEFILEILCFALGIGVICLFGAKFGPDIELSALDSDMIVLIGVLALFVLLLVIGAVIALFKRMTKKIGSDGSANKS